MLTLLLSWICYRLAFHFPYKNRPVGNHNLPDRALYRKIHDRINNLIDEAESFPTEEVFIRSYDGLRLAGHIYEQDSAAPVFIFFHGYQSTALRDGPGIFRVFRNEGFNVIFADQRAHGDSEGEELTLGVKESRDVMSWIRYARQRYGRDVKIILGGVSMGAGTVTLVADKVPDNVKGIVADCGYTSPHAIIQKVMRDKHIPVEPFYQILRLGAILFGHFDPDSVSCFYSLKHSRVPVLFIHGEADEFVPYWMSVKNYESCGAPSMLLSVPDADHGVAFMLEEEEYTESVHELLIVSGLAEE